MNPNTTALYTEKWIIMYKRQLHYLLVTAAHHLKWQTRGNLKPANKKQNCQKQSSFFENFNLVNP